MKAQRVGSVHLRMRWTRLGDSRRVPFHAPFNDPADLATVKQIEREMGDAMVAVDIDKLNQIYADEWGRYHIFRQDHHEGQNFGGFQIRQE
jgi:hypothetical protein